MVHRVGTLIHHLTTIYVSSVTCPQLEYSESQIHDNIHQRHFLSQKQPQKIIYNKKLETSLKLWRTPWKTSFFFLWWCNKNFNQSDFPHLAKKHILAPHNFFYRYPQCYHRVKVRIFNHQKPPEYQHQIRGWNHFSNLWGCRHNSQHPYRLQESNLTHNLDWILSHWFSKVTKYKKIPQIIKTSKAQAPPQKVQQHLSHYPRHFGKNFHTQSAQYLVANHLLKLPHALHIYNKHG